MTPSDLIEKIYNKAKKDINSLSAFERNVYVIANADFEVNLGGTTGYLYNTSGDELEDLVHAFREIGCSKLCDLANDIFTLISEYCNLEDRKARQNLLNSPSGDLATAFEKFEDGVQDQVEDYGELLEQYILKKA